MGYGPQVLYLSESTCCHPSQVQGTNPSPYHCIAAAVANSGPGGGGWVDDVPPRPEKTTSTKYCSFLDLWTDRSPALNGRGKS